MLELSDGMTLYHGSFVPVEAPDLAKCSPHKDFGQGFYLTSSFSQARNFARIVARRKIRERGRGKPSDAIVSLYRYQASTELAVRTYESANADWLHCIAAHRQGPPFEHVASELADTDIIIGKVANDQTNATILAYLAGAYGPTGSDSADDICIRLLLPERLDDQACFRSKRAIDCLEFCGCEAV